MFPTREGIGFRPGEIEQAAEFFASCRLPPDEDIPGKGRGGRKVVQTPLSLPRLRFDIESFTYGGGLVTYQLSVVPRDRKQGLRQGVKFLREELEPIAEALRKAVLPENTNPRT